MSTHGINQVLGQMKALQAMAQQQPAAAPKEITPAAPSFGEMMQQAIDSVNATQKSAADLSKAFELGDPKVDLTEVMVAINKSKVSFTALTEVRNKLLTAYQDVMNMPV